MVRKTKNGLTVIELGKGNLFTGVAKDANGKPYGVYFSNTDKGDLQSLRETVVVHLSTEEAIASYLMLLSSFVEETNRYENRETDESLKKFQDLLKPFMPKTSTN